MASLRGRSPSDDLEGDFGDIYRLDDFEREPLGAGFFSDVFKVKHVSSGYVMVLKMNKDQSNTLNMRKEIQLMNRLSHPNILKFEAVCKHEGQLHALTEFINGGTLEDLIQDKSVELQWSTRIQLGLDMTQGLEYLHGQHIFHRDFTSKNVFIRTKKFNKSFTAIIGDFGLATEIPKKTDPRLPQVGSPYWMSPECLRSEFYDERSDIFSFGIIMCELIARVSADPELGLPRTNNFGVEYKAFSVLCPTCPPDFLKSTFSCVSIDPTPRPSASSLVPELSQILKQQKYKENETTERMKVSSRLRAEAVTNTPVLKRFFSQDQTLLSGKKSPSEKARVHQRSCSKELPLETVESVCEEMCLNDPYYQAPSPQEGFTNPFATLPRLRKGRKIIGSICDNFSSCFEVPSPSPHVTSPTLPPSVINTRNRTKSLPNSPTLPIPQYSEDGIKTSSLLSQKIPPLIPEIDLSRRPPPFQSQSQDDSRIGTWSGLTPIDLPLRRAGSWESGFFSSSNTDWLSEEGLLSSRSIASSLLTVSDLEEDLRAASAFLSHKRTSSVFTDSLDDLSSGLDDISSGFPLRNYKFDCIKNEKYEKDIREIVEYFEKKCLLNRNAKLNIDEKRSSPEIARSQKIENLIKKVAENKSRARLSSRIPAQPQNNLQVCDGIVRSKLPIFDKTKKQGRNRIPVDQHGFVKARLAMFDQSQSKPRRKLVSDFMLQQQSRSKTTASSESRSMTLQPKTGQKGQN